MTHERMERTRNLIHVVLYSISAVLMAGCFRLAGLSVPASILGGLAATGVVLTAALMHGRRQKAVARPPATRSRRQILLSAAIAVSIGGLIGLSVGAAGRGAVFGAILIMPVDAMRVRLQARRR